MTLCYIEYDGNSNTMTIRNALFEYNQHKGANNLDAVTKLQP